MKQVSRKEFEEFIKHYQGELATRFKGLLSPPVLEYHDFSREKSLVGYTNYWDHVDEYGLRYHGWLDIPEEQRVYQVVE